MQIEGRNPVKETLNANISITKIMIQKGTHNLEDIVALAKEKRIRIDFLDKFQLDKISETKHHQGIIAFASDFKYTNIDDLLAIKNPNGNFFLLLDNIEDPHNLGSIIRVAECLGIDGVIIPNKHSATVNSTVLKISAGAANFVKISMVSNINDVIRKLKDDFYTVCCADMDGQVVYNTKLEKQDIALVIGSEGFGVKALTKKLCDKVLSIPQYGKINSLNASVACGILCYEISRQRNIKG